MKTKAIISILLIAVSFWAGWAISGITHSTELVMQFERGRMKGVKDTTDLFIINLGI